MNIKNKIADRLWEFNTGSEVSNMTKNDRELYRDVANQYFISLFNDYLKGERKKIGLIIGANYNIDSGVLIKPIDEIAQEIIKHLIKELK